METSSFTGAVLAVVIGALIANGFTLGIIVVARLRHRDGKAPDLTRWGEIALCTAVAMFFGLVFWEVSAAYVTERLLASIP